MESIHSRITHPTMNAWHSHTVPNPYKSRIDRSQSENSGTPKKPSCTWILPHPRSRHSTAQARSASTGDKPKKQKQSVTLSPRSFGKITLAIGPFTSRPIIGASFYDAFSRPITTPTAPRLASVHIMYVYRVRPGGSISRISATILAGEFCRSIKI